MAGNNAETNNELEIHEKNLKIMALLFFSLPPSPPQGFLIS